MLQKNKLLVHDLASGIRIGSSLTLMLLLLWQVDVIDGSVYLSHRGRQTMLVQTSGHQPVNRKGLVDPREPPTPLACAREQPAWPQSLTRVEGRGGQDSQRASSACKHHPYSSQWQPPRLPRPGPQG